MASTPGRANRHTMLTLAAALCGGVAWAGLVAGPDLFSPPPEPYFDLEQPAPIPSVAVVNAATTMLPSVQPPPERLATNTAAVPITSTAASQALTVAAPASTRTEAEPVGIPADIVPTPELPPVAPAGNGRGGEPRVIANAPAETESLRALVARVKPAEPQAEPPAEPRPLPRPAADGAAPLPGSEWIDTDGENWSDATGGQARAGRAASEVRSGGRLLGRIVDRRADSAAPFRPRLLDRLRTDRRGRSGAAEAADAGAAHWPEPTTLVAQLESLAEAGPQAATWATEASTRLEAVLTTAGPLDSASAEPLLVLGESVPTGMQAADEAADAAVAARIRRAALADRRRVDEWRSASALCAEIDAARRGAAAGELAADITAAGTAAAVTGVVEALERYETSRSAIDAAAARSAMQAVVSSMAGDSRPLDRAVADHYRSPNLRLAIDEQFVERMLPESAVTSGPLQDFVLGRRVRGTKRVEQSTSVAFVPHSGEIRLDLLVTGEVASRTVTDAGAVEIHSRGQSTFTVHKPIHLSAQGLSFRAARGTASSQTQLADIQTSFDGLPLVGSLVRGIARSQHDGMRDEAEREVRAKIVGRACREVDQQTEPQLAALADRIRERLWMPLVNLGLEPTAVALETTADAATARLRLAATEQLAAHTPRPRAPTDAMLSVQVHESAANNACGRLGLAGRTMSLEDLTRFICERLGMPPRVPDDLPEGVTVTFAADEPVRVECRDGLVHLRLALDALESGRRNNWYDIVACVTYRPVVTGIQVLLHREGPVLLSGDGQRGRMEVGLRTIFGKMFPRERPVPLVPEAITGNPRLAGVVALQAVSADGWLAIALGAAPQAGGAKTSATATRVPDSPARSLRR